MNNGTPLTAAIIANLFPGITSDVAHWREYGIETVEALGDHLDVEAAHNVYKDEHGHRPRFIATGDEARAYLESRAEAGEYAEHARQLAEAAANPWALS